MGEEVDRKEFKSRMALEIAEHRHVFEASAKVFLQATIDGDFAEAETALLDGIRATANVDARALAGTEASLADYDCEVVAIDESMTTRVNSEAFELHQQVMRLRAARLAEVVVAATMADPGVVLDAALASFLSLSVEGQERLVVKARERIANTYKAPPR